MINQCNSALIYPYQVEHICFFRAKDLLPFNTIIPVCYKGNRFANMDAGLVDKGPQTGTLITDDFEQAVSNVGTVILASNCQDSLDKLNIAIHSKKDIICLFDPNHLDANIKTLCDKNSINISGVKKTQSDVPLLDNRIAQIDTPIVVICGMSEDTQKFDLQAVIGKRLRQIGYNVSQIGSRSYSSLFSMHSFPDYLLNPNSEYDKLLYFNKFVKAIELTDEPDVIIIGFPGGTVPYNDTHNNMYGILSYIISQSISVDFSIFSMSYNHYDSKFFEFIHPYIKYRYGFNIDLFHLSNIYHDLEVNGEHDTILMDVKSIIKRKSELPVTANNILFDEDAIVQSLLNSLGSN